MFTVRRALAAAAVAATALLAMPAPVQAAPAAPLTFTVHDMGVSPAGKLARMRLVSGPGAPHVLTGVQVVLDHGQIDDFATAYVPLYIDGKLEPSPNCVTENAITTCSLGTLNDTSGWLVSNLFVKAKDGATVGRSGTLTVTLKSKEAGSLVARSTITVAEDVDLAAGPVNAKTTGHPGAPVDQPIEVRNTGTKPVAGVAVEFVAANEGLAAAARYRNCSYSDGDDVIFCKFDEELAPGTTYRIAAPVYQVRPKAPAKVYFYAHRWETADDVDEQGAVWYEGEQVTPGTGDQLHLEPVPAAASLRAKTTDSNQTNNFAFGYVDIAKTSPSSGPSSSSGASQPPAGNAAGGNGSGGGGLPITGPDVALAAGAGAFLLAAGVGLFIASRRRRTSFTA